MSAGLFTDGTFQGFDSSGNPLAAGKLYTYANGTTTPRATYTTAALDVANANPIILDSAGRAAVWLDSALGNYKLVLKTSADVTVWTVDEINVLTAPTVVDDTTPQLGGDLDVNGSSIISASNGDIVITPNGSGDINLDGQKFPQADGNAGEFLTTNGAGQLSYGTDTVIIDTTPQLGGNLDVNGQSIVSASAANIMITPGTTGDVIIDGLKHPQADGNAGEFLTTDGSAQLAFSTDTVIIDTTPQLGGNLDVNSNSIVSASAGDITLTPDTTGDIVLDGVKWPQADGTNGQRLETDGSAQAAWVSGGWQAIASTTASTSASIIFASLGIYNRLMVVFDTVDCATDNSSLEMTVSVDGGSTYLSTGYSSAIANSSENEFSTANVILTGTNSNDQGSGSGEEANGVIFLENVTDNSTNRKAVHGLVSYKDFNGNAFTATVVSHIDTTSDIDAIKFEFDSGTINSGIISVLGMN